MTAALIAGGAADGAVGGFSETLMLGGNTRDAIANALFGAAVGGVTGGIADNVLRHMDIMRYVFHSPANARSVLTNRIPAEVPELVAAAEARGWTVTTLARGQDAGSGLRMYDGRGMAIRWTPGTSRRHGGSYWQVSSNEFQVKIPVD